MEQHAASSIASNRTAVAYRDGRKVSPADCPVQVRPAGRGAMRDKTDEWDRTDEASDESFPASDPPSTY